MKNFNWKDLNESWCAKECFFLCYSTIMPNKRDPCMFHPFLLLWASQGSAHLWKKQDNI